MDDYITTVREQAGFYSPDELIELVGGRNSLLDPLTTLISKKAHIGKGNTFYPSSVVECGADGEVVIGDDNIFFPGVYIASTGGMVEIKDRNEFGPAGVTIRANKAVIAIGSDGRYCDGASIMGKTTLGSGSQILGAVTVRNCQLEAGGGYGEADPDQRGAVLKGFGLARDIALKRGEVMNGKGNFAETPIERQRSYHPHVK